MKRWFRWAAVLAAAVILWVGGLRLPAVIVPETARSFLAEDPPVWQGVVRVWHINDWNVPASSRSSCLEAAASRIEKEYPGVFVEIESFDGDAYWKALAAGDVPDMFCFPGGVEIPRNIPMTGMEIPEEMNGVFLRAAAAAGEKVWALPWLGISGLLLCDAENVPEDGDAWQAFSSNWQAGNRDALTCSWKNMLPMVLLQKESPAVWPAWGYRQAWDFFASRESGLLLGSQWDAAAMERRERAGKGHPWRASILPEDVPALLSVQWLAVPECGDSGKAIILRELVAALYAPEVQKKITQTAGAIPAVNAADEWFASDTQRLCYDRLQSGEVCVLRPGYALDAGTVLEAARGNAAACLQVQMITDRWRAGESEGTE